MNLARRQTEEEVVVVVVEKNEWVELKQAFPSHGSKIDRLHLNALKAQ